MVLLLCLSAFAEDAPVPAPSTPAPSTPAPSTPAPSESRPVGGGGPAPLADLPAEIPAFEAPPSPAEGIAGQAFPGLMNPAISLNGLFVGAVQQTDGVLAPPNLADEAEAPALGGAGGTFGTGLAMQEMELQLRANVDPYLSANVTFAFPSLEAIEIEEGYVQLVSVPRVLVSVGKIKEAFGRENLTHTHALLTIDRSLVGQRLLGEEGLNDVGVNAAALLPTPWFSELTVSVDRGTNEALFSSGRPGGFGYLGHWKNLVDLSYETSLEVGVSGAAGANDADAVSTLGGIDLTLKSHGRGARQFNRLVWQSELMFLDRGTGDDARLGGLYSTVEYSLTRRFWLGGRYDLVGLPGLDDAAQTQAASLLAVFAPTEFSAFRVQAQRQWLPEGHTVDSLVGQLNFTLGAHPAHAY